MLVGLADSTPCCVTESTALAVGLVMFAVAFAPVMFTSGLDVLIVASTVSTASISASAVTGPRCANSHSPSS